MQWQKRALIAMALGAVWPFLAQADLLQDGVNASNRSAYGTAITELTPLAEQGNPTAQAILGEIYLAGKGVPPNGPAGMHWTQLAANQNNARAEFNLGAMYQFAMYGMPHDNGTAAYWYQLAASQGQIAAEVNLAQLYYGGQGVPCDYAKAASLFQAAASKGEIRSAFGLGAMYMLGQGVNQNYELAYIWMSIAAAHMPDPALQQKYAKFRDQAAAKLIPAQLAEAKKRAANWCPCNGSP